MCIAPLGRPVEEEDSSDDDDDDFNGAMATAAREGHESIVRLMLERGADDYNWSSIKMPVLGQVALNDPTPGKRVHSMTLPQGCIKKISNIALKKISSQGHLVIKIENQFKEI